MSNIERISYDLSHKEYLRRVHNALELTKSKKEYQRVLAVWICHYAKEFKIDLTAEKIASMLEMGYTDVTKIHVDYLKHGCRIFSRKGGRCSKRCNIKTLAEEREFLTPFFVKGGKINSREIYDAYLKKLGRKSVQMSVIYRLIKRHEPLKRFLSRVKPNALSSAGCTVPE